MHSLLSYLAFIAVCVGMVMTPGPNLVYLISRTIAQGRRAGFVSLLGVALGFMSYMIAAAIGLSALFLAVPYAYDAVRLAGAAYLLWLAWQTIRPGGRSPFEVKQLSPDGPKKLFAMGLFTSLLNPKIAVMYLSLLPQFVDPALGHTFAQTMFLGLTQIVVSLIGNSLWIVSASSLTLFLARRPGWLVIQRYIMGTLLAGVALNIATEARR
jgi:threonine/homoserine/homoserine lactone efflux protein